MATPWLFEISFEICNKVGGIHTVISSKVPAAQRQFSDQYLTIGPYFPENTEFQPASLPLQFKGVATALRKKGIILHFGHWLIEGEPATLLVEWEGLIPQLNALKGHFWERFGLDTLGSDFYDLDQPLFWSVAVGMLIEEWAGIHPEPILVHAHEWLSAGALLQLAEAKLPHVHSVFTTHATVLGRALAAEGSLDLAKLATADLTQLAREQGVIAKHQLECLAASLCTVFTTVSRLTAKEAEIILARPVEVILENGLDMQQLPSFDHLCIRRPALRQRLEEFSAAYFFPSYTFDLSNTHFQYSMGRFEAHNKGFDLYLQALGDLNEHLKTQHSKQTVLSFFLLAEKGAMPKTEVLERIAVFNQVKEQFTSTQDYAHLLSRPASLTAQLLKQHTHPALQPALSPYHHPQAPLEELAHRYGLENREEDRVKVVIMPVLFDGFDGIFNLPLYQLISGFDLGVFPSLYEPWGYTPLESLALGVPAVTSTATGFGQSIISQPSPKPSGVFILNRDLPMEKQQEQLLSILESSLTQSEHIFSLRRIQAYLSAQPYSWEALYRHYATAYRSALGI